MRLYIVLFCTGVLGLISGPHAESKETRHTKFQARQPSSISAGESYAPVSTTCNKAHPKSEIRGLLHSCTSELHEHAQVLSSQCETTTSDNAPQVAAQIAIQLNSTLSLLKTNLATIQQCGADPTPLKADMRIAITDVAWSAFQLVLTLKPIYQVVSKLACSYTIIDTTCTPMLLKISLALSSLIGACSQQLNLFDTGFFALAGPMMKDFTDLGNNFAAFSGGFVA